MKQFIDISSINKSTQLPMVCIHIKIDGNGQPAIDIVPKRF